MTLRERNRLAQRQKILDHARELFATRGFEDVTVAEIARAAGVARATVFNHFHSKRALVEEITKGVLAFYLEMLEKALADETSSIDAIVRSLFAEMADGIEEARSFFRGVFREIAKLTLGLDEGSAEQRVTELALSQLEKLISRGQERGELRHDHDPRALASAFTSLLNGTITHWLYADSEATLRERMAVAAEIVLGPVAADWENDAGEWRSSPQAREGWSR